MIESIEVKGNGKGRHVRRNQPVYDNLVYNTFGFPPTALDEPPSNPSNASWLQDYGALGASACPSSYLRQPQHLFCQEPDSFDPDSIHPSTFTADKNEGHVTGHAVVEGHIDTAPVTAAGSPRGRDFISNGEARLKMPHGRTKNWLENVARGFRIPRKNTIIAPNTTPPQVNRRKYSESHSSSDSDLLDDHDFPWPPRQHDHNAQERIKQRWDRLRSLTSQAWGSCGQKCHRIPTFRHCFSTGALNILGAMTVTVCVLFCLVILSDPRLEGAWWCTFRQDCAYRDRLPKPPKQDIPMPPEATTTDGRGGIGPKPTRIPPPGPVPRWRNPTVTFDGMTFTRVQFSLIPSEGPRVEFDTLLSVTLTNRNPSNYDLSFERFIFEVN